MAFKRRWKIVALYFPSGKKVIKEFSGTPTYAEMELKQFNMRKPEHITQYELQDLGIGTSNQEK